MRKTYVTVISVKQEGHKHEASAILDIQNSSILFLKMQLANLFNIKMHLDLYVHTSNINYELFIKMLLRFN